MPLGQTKWSWWWWCTFSENSENSIWNSKHQTIVEKLSWHTGLRITTNSSNRTWSILDMSRSRRITSLLKSAIRSNSKQENVCAQKLGTFSHFSVTFRLNCLKSSISLCCMYTYIHPITLVIESSSSLFSNINLKRMHKKISNSRIWEKLEVFFSFFLGQFGAKLFFVISNESKKYYFTSPQTVILKRQKCSVTFKRVENQLRV